MLALLLRFELELIPENTLELHGLWGRLLVDIHRELNLFLECFDVLLSGKYVRTNVHYRGSKDVMHRLEMGWINAWLLLREGIAWMRRLLLGK